VPEAVCISRLAHTYMADSPLAQVALQDASLTLPSGKISALVGENGAGKSTLLHFINGLLLPRSLGVVQVLGQDLAAADLDLGMLRQRVGLVMQYPQQQLFERFVGDDIAYGPRQLGLTGDVLRERVYGVMRVVGLDPEAFSNRHTFSLSGGEMRRAAIAGVLATQPELLILDEVTTGLDPLGRQQMHTLLRQLAVGGTTVLIVSNDMDEVLALASHVVVLNRGRSVFEGSCQALFNRDDLAAWGLVPPAVIAMRDTLRAAGTPLDDMIDSLDDLEEALWQAWRA